MSDDLAKLSPPELAVFYRKLAASVDARKGVLRVSLAALLMNQWLDNRDRNSTFAFDAPEHLRSHPQVREALAYQRRVFLTEEKARLPGGVTKWAGVLPRLQGKAPFTKWDGSLPLALDYQSLVEMPLRYQLTGNDADRDLLYGLHGFQLKSRVTLSVDKSAAPSTGGLRLKFDQFTAQVIDRYDWDYSEHLKVPNFYYGSKEAGALRPDSKYIEVHHSNARRLEEAGLAAPYNLQTNQWPVLDAAISGPAVIDPSRSI